MHVKLYTISQGENRIQRIAATQAQLRLPSFRRKIPWRRISQSQLVDTPKVFLLCRWESHRQSSIDVTVSASTGKQNTRVDLKLDTHGPCMAVDEDVGRDGSEHKKRRDAVSIIMPVIRTARNQSYKDLQSAKNCISFQVNEFCWFVLGSNRWPSQGL